MEAVIQTTSQEEIEQAAASEDVSIISVVGKTVQEAAELRQHIPERVRELVGQLVKQHACVRACMHMQRWNLLCGT